METVSPVLLYWVAKERLGLTSLSLVIIQMALGHQNHREEPTSLLRVAPQLQIYDLIIFLMPLPP